MHLELDRQEKFGSYTDYTLSDVHKLSQARGYLMTKIKIVRTHNN